MIIFLLNKHEANFTRYLHLIAPKETGANTYTHWRTPNLRGLASKGYTKVVTTRRDVLEQLIPAGVTPSIFTYQGSLFHAHGMEIVIIDTIKKSVYDVPYCIQTQQYAGKVSSPELFPPQGELRWNFLKTPPTVDEKSGWIRVAEESIAMACDIETRPYMNSITLVGYTFIRKDLTTSTIVIPMISEDHHSFVHAMNATSTPKIFQNGQYDISIFLRWGLPVRNYAFDTMLLYHSWFHDFPKSLADITAFCVRDYVYWKEGRKETDEHKKALYNARDCNYTALSFLFMIRHAPDWAKDQHQYKMRRTLYGMTQGVIGLNVDPKRLATLRASKVQERDRLLDELRRSVGAPSYNPNSAPQTKIMLKTIASQRIKITSSDDETQKKVARLDPFCELIVDLLSRYKKLNKLITTYLDAELTPNNRLLFSMNVAGTTSDRWSSSSSNYWGELRVGAKGQPLKPKKNLGQSIMVFKEEARKHVVADEGMTLFSIDLPQSESRFTGYCSEDEKLIDAVENSGDFHCKNASGFFGIPYEELYDDESKTKLNVPLRNLSKRVNHGANYNMGAWVLLSTMGLENVIEAQKLLGLPAHLKPVQVCENLLERFRDTYPHIKGSKLVPFDMSWYGRLVKEVRSTGRITTPFGWTKFIMGDPMKHKPTMNNLASVTPQNMSQEYLHRGMERLYREQYEIGEFEILMPIHDEIVGQVKKGREAHYAPIIRDALVQEYVINGREFTIIPDEPVFGETWYEVH